MLTDEQQALQLAFTSLEEKFRKIQEDNNDLVKRYFAYEKIKISFQIDCYGTIWATWS